MDKMYYILIGVIVLVVAIDLYLKKKNKKSDSTDVDKFIEPSKKKKKNYFLIIFLAFLFISIGCVTFLHMQHQSIRNQFETNLKSVAELLQENKYDYCDSLVTQNKCHRSRCSTGLFRLANPCFILRLGRVHSRIAS